MRLFIIGKVLENGKIVAFKIYDANSGKSGIYHRFNVMRAVKEGKLVVGFYTDYRGEAMPTASAFHLSKVDIVNGKGEPVHDTGMYTLLGFSGFAEAKKYRLVNSSGVETIVPLEEFETLVDEGKVNGAIRSTKIKGRINLYKYCNKREYDY